MKAPLISMVALAAFLAGVLPLAGCSRLTTLWPARPEASPPDNQLQPHATWCYETLGAPDCYDRPQPASAGRLVNVYPQSKRPLTDEEHRLDVAATR